MNADVKSHVIYFLMYPIFYYLRDSKEEIKTDEKATLTWNNFLNILAMIPIAYFLFFYVEIIGKKIKPVAKDKEPNKEIRRRPEKTKNFRITPHSIVLVWFQELLA